MKRHLLILLLIATTAIFNSCQKEVSVENGDPSAGILQSDIGTGECMPMTVSGIYEAGTSLTADNYIEVTVDVGNVGTYTIYSDTLNGIYFRTTGVFNATGLNTVKLKGFGTPTASGIHNFIITYGVTSCTVDVSTLPAGGAVPAVFELDGDPGTCIGYDLQGTYTTGTIMNGLNKVVIDVFVAVVGTYNITTPVSNGISFSGTGVLAATGPATITLTASGTPSAAGTTNIAVTIPAPSSTTCSFQVDVVGPSAFTIDCATAVPQGTYIEDVPMGGSNSVDVVVNVTTVGAYTITGSLNGMTFSKTGTFTTTGNQTITLVGGGTPDNAGLFNIPLTGGTGTCTIPITVAPAAGPASFVINCGTAAAAGTYTQGVALVAATNTISVQVNVTTLGSYTITGTVNGMTFTKTGVFTTAGNQTVTLAGSGSPTTAGAFNVNIGGATTCNVPITVVPGAGGPATYVVDCGSADINGTYADNVALVAANNYVDIDVNVTVIGSYTITGTVNGMTFSKTGNFAATGVQTVRLDGSGTPVTDGTFTVNLTGGTTPCGFQIDVDEAPLGTWQFNVGATVHQGTIFDADMDLTTLPGAALFFFIGDNAAGEEFELDLLDINATIVANETYTMATLTLTQNEGGLYFVGIPPKEYTADFNFPTNTISARITSHNVATKTIVGTFTGKAMDENNVLTDITGGTFTVTYP